MNRKTLLHCALAGLLLAALALVGCSGDTQRIITGSHPSSTQSLATNDDGPGVDIDWEEYISNGYYPGDQTTDDVLDDVVTLGDHDEEDNPNRKPLDNGKN